VKEAFKNKDLLHVTNCETCKKQRSGMAVFNNCKCATKDAIVNTTDHQNEELWKKSWGGIIDEAIAAFKDSR